MAPAAGTTLRTTRVWGDTITRKTCEYAGCRQGLWLARHVRTGNYMVFEGEPTAISKQPEIETGREAWLVDLALEHWSKCHGAAQFRRRARKGPRYGHPGY